MTMVAVFPVSQNCEIIENTTNDKTLLFMVKFLLGYKILLSINNIWDLLIKQ